MGQLGSYVCNSITGYITANSTERVVIYATTIVIYLCALTIETDKENGVGEIKSEHE